MIEGETAEGRAEILHNILTTIPTFTYSFQNQISNFQTTAIASRSRSLKTRSLLSNLMNPERSTTL